MRWRSLLVAEMDKYWKKQAKSGQWHFTQQSTQSLKNFGVEGSGKLAKYKFLDKCQNAQWFTYSFFVDFSVSTKFE